MKHILYTDLKEWIESPIGEIVKEVMQKELNDVYVERSDFFLEDNPQKTHTVRAGLIGQESILQDVIGIMELDGPTLEKYFELHGVEIVRNDE